MKDIKKLMITLVALLAVTTGAWAQGPWTSGDCTVTFSDGVMTVSGTGAMADYTSNSAPWSDSDVKTIVIESGVTSIGNSAFAKSYKVESVSIPASVTSIGRQAFEMCGSNVDALTVSVAEGSSPLTIGERAFYYANLTSIDMPNRVTSIGEQAFSGCSNLESVSIPASVTSISEEAFWNCGMLAKVYIFAPILTTYGDMAFDDNADGRKIYVLTDAVDTYKAGWPAYAADIVGDLQPLASGPKVAWDKATKTGKFTMPGGNVTLEPEYYPQAALTAEPTAINDVPATTDGAIVKAGTVANIGSTTTAQGTLMYYVSPTALDDAALLALAADAWKADVPTAKSLAQGQAYVYYYVRGNDSDTDEENFSDGDILAANALTVTIAAEPTKVTMAVNDKTMGTAEVCGQSKVEWTADTWKGWTSDIKEHTVDDITITGTQKTSIYELTSEDKYKNSLLFFVVKVWDNSTVTFSTTGDPFSRIEFTMIDDYSQYNPNIIPNDNWTVEGKSAVWEGEATKSLTLQSCSTNVSKITFFKGAIPDGVTINGDGTFTVAKTATVTLKATPAEGYKFLYWEDDQTNTNPVRKVTIESGMADMTYKAVFAEITYNVTFAEGTDPNEWTASPAADVKKGTPVTVTYTGTKKVIGVKAEKKAAPAEEPTLAEATAEDYGKVVCAAGHLHDAKTAVPTGCTAVGILGKVTETGHGLILALQNATEQEWTTINGWTSASYAGTTLKVLPDDTARGSLTSYTKLGETAVSNWAVAQKSDYDAIFQNLGSTTGNDKGKTYDDNVNAYITTGVGSTAIDGRYWSATEDGGNYAWYFRSDKWSSDNKGESHNVRPVLGF